MTHTASPIRHLQLYVRSDLKVTIVLGDERKQVSICRASAFLEQLLKFFSIFFNSKLLCSTANRQLPEASDSSVS